MRGARLAYASEGDVSARLDSGKVKELTGNEPITARALYKPGYSFPLVSAYFAFSAVVNGPTAKAAEVWHKRR